MKRRNARLTTTTSVGIFFVVVAFYMLYDGLNKEYFPLRRIRPAYMHRSRAKSSNIDHDIDLLKNLDIQFLPNFKNPCWYETTAKTGSFDQCSSFYYKLVSNRSKKTCKNITKPTVRLRCLPYFFLIGQPKCATTDLFQRITIHPDVVEPLLKGPHWWTRRRYGQPYASKPVNLSEYLEVFNKVADEIKQPENLSDASNNPFYHKITGDGSTSTLWDSSIMMNYIYSAMDFDSLFDLSENLFLRRGRTHILSDQSETFISDAALDINTDIKNKKVSKKRGSIINTTYNRKDTVQLGVVLPITVADVIHSMLPKAKIIAVVRDPVSRLYSSFAFFSKKVSVSPETFDKYVHSSVEKWQQCVSLYSERTCAYNRSLHSSMSVRLHVGLYSIYLRDWLSVFPREQVMVVRMEDYHENITKTMDNIYNHLELRPLTNTEKEAVNVAPVRNKNKKKNDIGKMFNSTTKVLQKFYDKSNRDLAELLRDQKFTWYDVYSKNGYIYPEYLE